ncbi:MAG: ZIP family metal transporter [Planctomycetaceae bacterium]|nr:ZIP family metal transporter [Planctomycetaceae bacterium]
MVPSEVVVAEEDSHSQHGHSESHDHGHNHDLSVSEAEDKEAEAPGEHKLSVLLGYCALIILGSFLGGHLPSFIHLDHNRTQTIISLVGGLMLGIGVFHMLPHALHEVGDINFVSRWMMVGLLVMFFLLRTFHFHQHDVVVDEHDAQPAQLLNDERALKSHNHDHDHDDGHHHDHSHHHHHHAHELSWVGISVGLCLHTLIDGLALGAAVEADAHHEVLWSLFGLGTFLAILLHKPLDAMSITSLMKAGGWSQFSRNLVNLGFSMMCPLGALAFVLGVNHFEGSQTLVIGGALAAAAGVFICISLSDLLPEMEFHSHNRMRLSTALVVGILLAWGIGFLEPGHAHNMPDEAQSEPAHEHHGHSH